MFQMRTLNALKALSAGAKMIIQSCLKLNKVVQTFLFPYQPVTRHRLNPGKGYNLVRDWSTGPL